MLVHALLVQTSDAWELSVVADGADARAALATLEASVRSAQRSLRARGGLSATPTPVAVAVCDTAASSVAAAASGSGGGSGGASVAGGRANSFMLTVGVLAY